MATDVEEGMFLDYQTRPLSQEAGRGPQRLQILGEHLRTAVRYDTQQPNFV